MKNDPKEFYLEADGTENYDKREDGIYKKGKSPNEKATQFKAGKDWTGNAKGKPPGPNKATLRQRLLDAGGMTPAEFLISVMLDDTVSMPQRMKAASDAAKFIDPTLASVQLEGKIDQETTFNFTMIIDEDSKDEVKKLKDDVDVCKCIECDEVLEDCKCEMRK